jgi:hypothetical protein
VEDIVDGLLELLKGYMGGFMGLTDFLDLMEGGDGLFWDPCCRGLRTGSGSTWEM